MTKNIRQMTVQEMLTEWRGLTDVMLRLRMGCVGCSFSSFCRLSDVEAAYPDLSSRFLEELDTFAQTSMENIEEEVK